MRKRNKNFKFKHELGQNFLTDEFILDDIAVESKINKEDYVLEIGPGNGALTRCLSDRVKHVVAVEIDKTLIPLLTDNLKDYTNVTIINVDYLNYDFDNIIKEFEKFGYDKEKEHIKVVANLPYYITSPIIMSILFNPYISEMTIMVQKEVAERIVGTPKSKEYGVLTLACNYFSKTECLFIVDKECFFPVPKVDSAVVRFIKNNNFLDIHNDKNFHIEEDEEYKKLFFVIKSSFSQRRKKLINSLMNVGNFDKEILIKAIKELGFDENIRAENLSLDDYKKLTRIIG